jgi:hypothetical protein
MKMAHLNWHGKIVQIWKHKEKPDIRLHITETGRVIRTTGPRFGGAKMLRYQEVFGRPVISIRRGKFAGMENDAVREYVENYFVLETDLS